MSQQIAILLCVVPILPEVLVLVVRPTWLVFLPLWDVSEHRFTLRSPRRMPAVGGYREAGGGEAPPMPALPARTDFEDSVLFCDGPRLALRRAFGLGRRAIWLVRIDVTREADTVILRARQCFSPMAIVVAGPLMGLAVGRGSVIGVVGFPLLMIAVYLVQIGFATSARRGACEVAFATIETELRRELETKSDHRIL